MRTQVYSFIMALAMGLGLLSCDNRGDLEINREHSFIEDTFLELTDALPSFDLTELIFFANQVSYVVSSKMSDAKTDASVSIPYEFNNGIEVELESVFHSSRMRWAGLSLMTPKQSIVAVNMYVGIQDTDSFDPDDPTASFNDNDDLETVSLNAVVMDKLRLKGRVADMSLFLALMDSIRGGVEQESLNSLVDSINSHLDLGLYYEGSDVRQASFELEGKCRSEYDGTNYVEKWDISPVIVMADGSRTLIGGFFDDDRFKTTSWTVFLFVKKYWEQAGGNPGA
jgi:hypothetical protein